MEPAKWEQVLVSWMNGKSLEFQIVPNGTTEVVPRDDFQIVELENLLVDHALIPAYLRGNNDLYIVLLRRMQLQLMYCVTVPPRRDEPTCTFAGQIDCRRQLMREIQGTLDKSILHLEKKTGVNLAYYWKIPVREKQLKEAKQVGVQHEKRIKQNTKKGIYLEEHVQKT
jgi:hypothetical protein